MFRFLKWIFLIFGGIATSLLIFFYNQNKHDIKRAWEFYNKLNYSSLRASCLNIDKEYYYPCFKSHFEQYVDEVSLTGVSIGLKLAFNFMDDDKAYAKIFINDAERDIAFSLNHLEINNLAIKNSYRHFYGFEFTYGGFVGKVKENLERSTIFTTGLIDGLKGKSGINHLKDTKLREFYSNRLIKLLDEYEQNKKDASSWVDAEVKILKDKYGEVTL